MGPLLTEGSWRREEQRGRLGERKGKLEKWKKIHGNCFEFFFLCWPKPLLQWFVGERSGWLHTLALYYVAMTFLSLLHFSAIMLTLIP